MQRVDMATAVGEAADDGQCVFLPGFTHLTATAAAHELIRQGPTDLTVGRISPDLVFDQLIAAGCVSTAIFSFAGRGLRRELEREESGLEIEEYTHYSLAARVAAGARNLPFMPVRTFTGSDLPAHTAGIKTVESPYDGEEIYVVPPLQPDLTIAHVPRADENGNAQVWGSIGEVRDAIFAASTVVLSAEEVVEEDIIRSDPNRTIAAGSAVDYLVEEPWGAHPSYVQGHYDRDLDHYASWRTAVDEGRTDDWLEEWVYGVADRREYLDKLDATRLVELEPDTNYATPIDMGEYR
ncbi:MAG: CoA transferase subunit A [Salinirussus sp.]